MKQIIIYDTDKGFTKKCALFLQENLQDSEVVAMESFSGSFTEYDEVYIGTYIIKGVISKTTQKFLKQQYTALLDKKLKLFVSALDKSDYDHALQTSLHPEIFYRSKIVNCGGRIVFEDLTLLEKRAVKKFLDTKEDVEVFHEKRLLDLISR